jgi:hypothetical protein
MESLYETSPDIVPKPHNWGTFQMEAPETYFFLCHFIDMTDSMTDNMTKTHAKSRPVLRQTRKAP